MVLKYEHLMLPGRFPDKVTPDIDFADGVVVPCDCSSCENTFVDASNLQITT